MRHWTLDNEHLHIRLWTLDIGHCTWHIVYYKQHSTPHFKQQSKLLSRTEHSLIIDLYAYMQRTLLKIWTVDRASIVQLLRRRALKSALILCIMISVRDNAYNAFFNQSYAKCAFLYTYMYICSRQRLLSTGCIFWWQSRASLVSWPRYPRSCDATKCILVGDLDRVHLVSFPKRKPLSDLKVRQGT